MDKNRDWNVAPGFDWFDAVYEMFIERMKSCGIEVGHNDIYFSGFCSQGDGASFVGGVESWELFVRAHELEKHYPKVCEAWKLSCSTSDTIDVDLSFGTGCRGQYSHSYTMYPKFDYDFTNESDEDIALSHAAVEQVIDDALGEIGTLEDHLLQIFRGYADELYEQLEKEYDYLTTDEAIVESLFANDSFHRVIDQYYEEFEDENDPFEEAPADVLPS